jgi:hypothetical protein
MMLVTRYLTHDEMGMKHVMKRGYCEGMKHVMKRGSAEG